MDSLMMQFQNMNINLILDTLEFYLKMTGGMHEINRAIETNDLAIIVRASAKALKKIGIPDRFAGHAYLKSTEESNKFRREGNLHYINRDYKSAIILFNKALAYAPNDSLELKLAFSNIAAIMLTIKAYQACKLNIEAALESDCPEFLRVKLEQRMIEVNKYIDEEIARDAIICSDEDTVNYAELDVPRNADIPCVTMDVCVDSEKNVVAAGDIQSGTVVALERAFVSFQDEINEYVACFYCHKMSFFFIPCKGCCKALFCSKECREKCLDDYHRIECHIVARMYVESQDINQHLNKLAARVAIKLSLKLGWQELMVASLGMGKNLLQQSSVATAFDSNNPVSILCYDDQTPVPRDVMMNRSLVTAMTVHWLSRVPDYLPQDDEEREQAIDTLSRIILHLNTTFMRQVAIVNSAIDYEKPEANRITEEVLRNIGWFSFTSKVAHSCEPNLLALGLNDHVALVAMKRIKKGDLLSICYTVLRKRGRAAQTSVDWPPARRVMKISAREREGFVTIGEHFYDMNIMPCPRNSRVRQKLIFKLMEYTCLCRVCLEEWHNGTQVEANLNSRQIDAYNQYRTAMENGSFKHKIEAISAALDELSDCTNTKQQRSVYKDFRKTLMMCQCAKNLNKSYGCVQTLHPYHNYVNYLND